MVKWNEKCQEFCLAGFPMTHASKKPLLHQIKAGNYSMPSNTPPNGEENVLNIQRGEHRHPQVSIDLIAGEELDLGDTDSMEESEAWSAHDKSTYLST